MPERYKRIFIINVFGIGDVLFSTPMLKTLKKHIPGIRIDFMCNKRCQYILQNNKHIDDIIVFEKDEFREIFKRSKLKFIKNVCSLIKKISSKKYDLAIDLSLGYHIALPLKFLGVKKRIGFNYRERGKFLTDKLAINGFDNKHVVEYYLEILKLIGITEFADKNLELALSSELDRWADNFVENNKLEGKCLIGIAPGGGRSWGKYAVYRRWSPQNFSYVAQNLFKKNKNIFFLIFGSKTEKDISQTIENKVGDKCINMCGRLSLSHSIALIKKCRLLLCNDGGILHIAVSQGVSTISIFGPVNDKVYGPYPVSNKHRVVKAEGVGCRPCYKSFKHKMCETRDCLEKIDKNEVLKLAEENLGL